MLINIISMIMLVIPPAITSQSSWTSPDIRITTEWSLNVLDLIDPAHTHLGTVYGVESEEGFEWHTILIDKDCILHFEGNNLIGNIPYSGDIYLMNFSPDCQHSDRQYNLGSHKGIIVLCNFLSIPFSSSGRT
jgi:hypothetical protein